MRLIMRLNRLNRQALHLYEQDDYSQAIGIATVICNLACQQWGEEHPRLAIPLYNLAEMYYEKNFYAQAEPLYQRVLKIRRQALGEKPDLIDILRSLAWLYRDMGNYAQAELFLLEIVEIVEATQGKEHPDIAEYLNNLAIIYSNMSKYTLAEPLLKRALRINLQVYGENNADIATSLDNLATLYSEIGDYTNVEQIYMKALNIRQTILDENDPGIADSLIHLAVLHTEQGDYAQAEEFLGKALTIYHTALGVAEPKVAITMNMLAKIYMSIGRYASARHIYETLLEWRRSYLNTTTHPDIAESLNNLGAFYSEIGDYVQAEPLLQEVLISAKDVYGARSLQVASCLDQLGLLYQKTKKYDKAISLLQQALEIVNESPEESLPEKASYLNDLALLHNIKGNYVEAEALYSQALQLRREIFGDKHPYVAQLLNNLGSLSYEIGNYTAAESLLREALDIKIATRGGIHTSTADSLTNLALLYTATDRPSEAFECMLGNIFMRDNLIEQVFTIGSERQRMGYPAVIRGDLDVFLSLLLQCFSQDVKKVKVAWNLVLRRKAIAAEALSIQRNAVLGNRDPALASMLRELKDLHHKIIQKTLAGPGQEKLENHFQRLEEWGQQKEQLEVEIARHLPEMNLMQQLLTANEEKIASMLPEDTALIEFIRFRVCNFQAELSEQKSFWQSPHYIAFVMTAKSREVQLIDLGEAQRIDEMIAAYRRLVMTRIEPVISRNFELELDSPDVDSEQESGDALRKAVFEPLLVALDACTQLFLSPDGNLAQVPFEVLPDVDKKSYLIDKYRISYLSTARDILRFHLATSGQCQPSLVIASPAFDLSIATIPAQDTIIPPYGKLSKDLQRSSLQFERLDKAKVEGEQVASLLGVRPLLEEDALEGTLKAYHSPYILHIATHGFFLPDQNWLLYEERLPIKEGELQERGHYYQENPLLRSGLAFAGANTWGRGGALPMLAEDGIVTADDISELDLSHTELVVLSACETGLGVVHTEEGVLGLRRAFVIAGARTLIMSLWKVPDEQTQELMKDFYLRVLDGQGCAEALRGAQLTVKARHPAPYYWGAFICQGSPGPLRR